MRTPGVLTGFKTAQFPREREHILRRPAESIECGVDESVTGMESVERLVETRTRRYATDTFGPSRVLPVDTGCEQVRLLAIRVLLPRRTTSVLN
jgi:hypothetical protein